MYNVNKIHVRVSAKSGNSLYTGKSQGKVREFREKSGNFSEIKKSFFKEQQIEEKISKFRYISKTSDLERINTRKKVYEMLIKSQGKLEKSLGKVREFRVKNLADTLHVFFYI